MATFTGIMTGIGTAIALASATNAVVQGQDASKKQKAGLRQQTDAQKAAESAAVSEARRAEEAQNRANRQTPDVAALLKGQESPLSGLLTGAGGIDPRRLTLGRKSLLGG